MKRIRRITCIALAIAVNVVSTIAFAQEEEIPVLFDRTYLEEMNLTANWWETWQLYMNNDLLKQEIVQSPDGQWLAFIGMGVGIDCPTGKDIWIVPSDGGEPRAVYVIPDDELYPYESEDKSYRYQGYVSSIGFAANGSEITFCRHSALGILPTIESVNIQTGAVRTIVEEGECPDWSIDGYHLAYIHHDSPDDVLGRPAVYTPATGKTWIMPENDNDYKYIDIMLNRDNSHLYGVVDISPYNRSMVKISIVTGEESIIPIGELRPNHLKRSPGGRFIIYTDAIINARDQIMIMDTRAEEKIPVFQERPEYDMHHGLITPDGGSIIYLRPYQFKYENISEDGSHMTSFTTKAIMICRQPIDLEELFGSIDDPLHVSDVAPVAELLIANHPNPFNPSTTISFSLPSADIARLDIYSLSGQKVRELVKGDMTAGMHNIVWDGRNDSGMPLATGVYIARIVTGNHVATRQMLLVK